jgi:outer membrane lipoprotein
MAKRYLLAAALCLWAGACVKPPAPLAGGPFAEITVPQAQQQSLEGQRVRWGGEIVTTTTSPDETCFEVVSRPLDAAARPRWTDQSDGRFLACTPRFYDPAVYSKGRELTVIGTLQAPTMGKIGEYEYRYPRVAAEEVYLWPQRPPYGTVYYYPWGGPVWYPFGYPYWYPYWGGWPPGPWLYPYWGPR